MPSGALAFLPLDCRWLAVLRLFLLPLIAGLLHDDILGLDLCCWSRLALMLPSSARPCFARHLINDTAVLELGRFLVDLRVLVDLDADLDDVFFFFVLLLARLHREVAQVADAFPLSAVPSTALGFASAWLFSRRGHLPRPFWFGEYPSWSDCAPLACLLLLNVLFEDVRERRLCSASPMRCNHFCDRRGCSRR